MAFNEYPRGTLPDRLQIVIFQNTSGIIYIHKNILYVCVYIHTYTTLSLYSGFSKKNICEKCRLYLDYTRLDDFTYHNLVGKI